MLLGAHPAVAKDGDSGSGDGGSDDNSGHGGGGDEVDNSGHGNAEDRGGGDDRGDDDDDRGDDNGGDGGDDGDDNRGSDGHSGGRDGGEPIPLRDMLAIFAGYGDLTVVDVGLIQRGGGPQYKFRYIDSQGRVRNAYFDALTGDQAH